MGSYIMDGRPLPYNAVHSYQALTLESVMVGYLGSCYQSGALQAFHTHLVVGPSSGAA